MGMIKDYGAGKTFNHEKHESHEKKIVSREGAARKQRSGIRDQIPPASLRGTK
jgi:hypothetical protein